jgi:phosphoglycolate phosphatase
MPQPPLIQSCPANLRAAIVDLDGTMVDTMGDFVVAIHHMLADLGLPPTGRASLQRMVGKGSEHLIRSVLQEVAPERAGTSYEAAWLSYQRHYLVVNGQHSHVFPGVSAGLQRLRQRGWKLACLTNKPTAFALPLLKAKGLDGYFTQIFGGDSFARKKPDPMPLLGACEALGVAPADTLMIGDSSNDAQAARAAGCPVVLVTYGYNHGEPVRAVDADGFLDSLEDLFSPDRL